MCRHLAYVGPRRTLHDLVYGPPHSLEVQAYAPRMSRSCLLNADGFGVGWYADEDGPGAAAGAGTGSRPGPGTGPETRAPAPVRYRRTGPIWNDVSFAEVARVLRSRCVLAAVRSATPGFPADESCAQPFRAGRWLFSHNGRVDGFPDLEGRLREAAHAALAGDDGTGVVARVGTPAEVAGTPGTGPSGPDVHASAAGTGVSDGMADGGSGGPAAGAAIGSPSGGPTGTASATATDVADGGACGLTGAVTTGEDDGEDDGAASGWAGVPDARAPVDSALLFAIAVGRWRRGATLADGLADVVTGVPGLAGSRLNLLATDGMRLAATAWGDTLFTRGDQIASGVVIASEPYDDAPDWTPVPDRSLVIADADGLRVRPIG